MPARVQILNDMSNGFVEIVHTVGSDFKASRVLFTKETFGPDS